MHETPCHHNLDEYLHAYMDQGQLTEPKGWLFRSANGRSGQLSTNPMRQADVYRMLLDGRSSPRSGRGLAVTRSEQRGSRRTCGTAASSRSPSRWPTKRARRRPGCMTGLDQVSLDEVERIVI